MKLRQIYREIRVIKYYAEKYSESKYLQIQSHHWGGDRKLSMEGVSLGYLNNDKFVREVNP